MLTFAKGKYFVRASSIDEGLLIIKELEKTQEKKGYPHEFDKDRKCKKCGLSQRVIYHCTLHCKFEQ